MKVNSYTFQSPYPQAFQVGRPNPSSMTQEETSSNAVEKKKETQPMEAKIAPTKGSDMSISISTLADANSQSGVSAFKSLSTSLQGQKAYAQETASAFVS